VRKNYLGRRQESETAEKSCAFDLHLPGNEQSEGAAAGSMYIYQTLRLSNQPAQHAGHASKSDKLIFYEATAADCDQPMRLLIKEGKT